MDLDKFLIALDLDDIDDPRQRERLRHILVDLREHIKNPSEWGMFHLYTLLNKYAILYGKRNEM